MRLSEFAHRSGGRLVGEDAVFTGFALDSAQVKAGDIFVAIKGARVDGHDFVAEALRSGALAALVERPTVGPSIVVPSVVAALASFGNSIRHEFKGPVIGVTGSAGKTTTKEFVAAALAPLGPILKSPGNRNTEFSSPLVWFEAKGEVAAVIEMSMRGSGQIAHLAKIAEPEIGIVTNVGYAHVDLVGSREGIARAKAELFENLSGPKIAILWAEDEFRDLLRKTCGPEKWLTFGASPDADCQITSYRSVGWTKSVVSGSIHGEPWTAELPVIGRHIALNAAAAIAAARSVGVAVQAAATAMGAAVLPPMRMEWVEQNGIRFLQDTYNASPPATIAAIETVRDLPVAGRRLAVLGEMRELGPYAEAAHRAVGRAVAEANLDEILLYGPSTPYIGEAAMDLGFPSERVRTAESIEEVRTFLRAAVAGDVVLIKGSRALELEQALDR